MNESLQALRDLDLDLDLPNHVKLAAIRGAVGELAPQPAPHT